jgi:proteasome assembly chaperone (PAC2) family protein
MDKLIDLWEKPEAEEIYMIAGWHQWADAGSISSGLPDYLIKKTGARKIGEMSSAGYYLFQIPGAHHFLRPQIKLKDGYRKSLEAKSNEFFYTGNEKKGVVFFLGDEPHLEVEQYARGFFEAVKVLGVKRVAAVGGVYGAMPYDQDREVSCIYSLREMKRELVKYAVKFSNYEGGATIGSYLLDRAEREGVEFFVFYAFVPAYDFAQPALFPQGVRIENDFRAWYEILVRLEHMFSLEIDLSGLEKLSEELVSTMDSKLDELEEEMPQLKVRQYIDSLSEDFEEMSFVPLGDVWERGLRDLFNDSDD